MSRRVEAEVRVPIDKTFLEGTLAIPENAAGLVLFAHGSGSSRMSPRNRFVAESLRQGRLATLLIDLLTQAEERLDLVTTELRFDIGLLAERVTSIVDWLAQDERTRSLNIGLFGSSTGAAAALVAAASRANVIRAIVSRGGRPDLASGALPEVCAPTLLIVGGDDTPVIEMNRTALEELKCEKRLEIVPGATHLFEEPGKLEEVARLAREWFECYLGPTEVRMRYGEPVAPMP